MKRNKNCYFTIRTGLNQDFAPSNSILYNIFYYICTLFVYPLFSISSFVIYTLKYFKYCVIDLHKNK